MSKYDVLWNYVQKCSQQSMEMTFDEIAEVSGVEIDHSFLNYKKELCKYGWQVEKISMKDQKVIFTKDERAEREEFVNFTPDNLKDEHLCCIIRSKKIHPGVESKRKWLFQRLNEGHVFRKLNAKAAVFIEYAPLETAWVPIDGENFYYIYCLWVSGDYKGKGYGKELIEYCLNDAKANGKSGVCMLGAQKQKAWLSDQSFAKKYGFEAVETTNDGYELLAVSFDGTKPKFSEDAKKSRIKNDELTIYYSPQCPFTYQCIEKVKEYCERNDIKASFIKVDTLKKAKKLPCVFNNWAVFYKGKFETVNLLDVTAVKRILKK